MFKKILVVEDMEIANYGIIKTLTDKQIIIEEDIYQTQSCDKALLLFKKAIQEKNPFDLVITDLSFEKNYKDEKIISGIELIKELRKIEPNTKIIVYSIEDIPLKINTLFEKQKINGYIVKDGYDAKELIAAIKEIYQGNKYRSTQLLKSMNKKNSIQLDDYHQLLIDKLVEGYTQKEIREYFVKHNIKPYSKSIIEKRLEKLKLDFEAKSIPHLVAILKDFGLI
ncbi:response regulator transcription factor [Kordia sp. YSTF-M3]|uniref:Response regulator transcription factor n=1 Tax=Kordia aestuariivivens TaxID=2759037 RepID=A0ABR7QBR7_9FLAO|nr:response regulator [Kordia aestuariivivens]MBC8755977.1 response regulator transcription factor [Kordia aestuariivivens]